MIASTWGFAEAALASIAGALAFNYFFLPPVGTFTIADPQNWFALFSFLATSLIASRLSATAKRRALDAIELQQNIERLYSFSRAILLINSGEPFAKQLVTRLAEIFTLNSVVLHERQTGEIYHAGPSEFEGLDDQLRDAAIHGASLADPDRNRVVTAVRPVLSRSPVWRYRGGQFRIPFCKASSVWLQSGWNERGRQDLAGLNVPSGQSQPASRKQTELLKIADQEADHLKELIDDSINMARLDTATIDVDLEICRLDNIVREVVDSMQTGIEDRAVEVTCDEDFPAIAVDRRLVKLAVKQLLDNALKYSPANTPVSINSKMAPTQ